MIFNLPGNVTSFFALKVISGMEEVLQRLETQLEVMSDQEEPTDTTTSTTEARGNHSRQRRDTEAMLNMQEAL